jgi:uncharacterized membrane protein HdeD (DUF308 family)
MFIIDNICCFTLNICTPLVVLGNDDNLVYCCLLEMLIGANFVGHGFVIVMIFYLIKTIQC